MKIRIKEKYEKKYKSEFIEVLKQLSKTIKSIDLNNEEEVINFLEDFNDNTDYIKYNMMGIYAKISTGKGEVFEEVESV